ncbi:thymidine kinase [Flavobacteriaceae bacterium]|nr:thymidine kinase [Flavobacteriaceae bacterium]
MFLENTSKTHEQFGWIEIICGSMFSGKTEELIRRLKRAKYAKKKVKVFKPIVDSRFNTNLVSSHDKNQIKSKSVSKSSDIRIKAVGSDVVGIDEAQFFDNGIIKVCNDLANEGIRVIIAGLDMDYKGNPFGPMPNLMATAEYVTKVHAICAKSGNLANHSHRISTNKSLIHLGEKESYIPLSRAEFQKIKK